MTLTLARDARTFAPILLFFHASEFALAALFNAETLSFNCARGRLASRLPSASPARG